MSGYSYLFVFIVFKNSYVAILAQKQHSLEVKVWDMIKLWDQRPQDEIIILINEVSGSRSDTFHPVKHINKQVSTSNQFVLILGFTASKTKTKQTDK